MADPRSIDRLDASFGGSQKAAEIQQIHAKAEALALVKKRISTMLHDTLFSKYAELHASCCLPPSHWLLTKNRGEVATSPGDYPGRIIFHSLTVHIVK